MATDDERISRVLEDWCGESPDRAGESLASLWDRTGEAHGHDGIPFDDEGAEKLLQLLVNEFTDRDIRLRPRDLVGLTVGGLVLALPAPARRGVARRRPPAKKAAGAIKKAAAAKKKAATKRRRPE